ncbi:structure-specific endonuclease subunit MUS81 isoform X1 [Denticeps clupeoides]|uniref:Crossover junction endonuclease MUS81 n=1 Tax=Denticeps clupeoides TaxID=299321 RepID=A0AAY3ZUS2_9TELE|nr:crossover junction endonuclease MUS81 isoform X1 [Denticeps clupeoides]
MPPEPVRLGRKRPLPACPNPLFLQWLTELRDQAAERGQKTQYVYQKALGSLKKYPLPLRNGKEAKILQNFGDGICKILDDRLEKHYRENGRDAPIHSLPKSVKASYQHSSKLASSSSNPRPQKEPLPLESRRPQGDGGRRKREYVPQKGSGGHAVLLTLYRQSLVPGTKGFMFKNELQTEAQPLCDKSFTVPDLGSKYTAWSSVTTLIQKELLLKTHNPARYSLTELGLDLAERLHEEEKGRGEGLGAKGKDERCVAKGTEEGSATVDLTADEDEEEDERDVCGPADVVPASTTWAPSQGSASRDMDQAQRSQTVDVDRAAKGVSLSPGSYDIVLCVDFIETTGGKQELVKELQRNGVNFDIRKLHVGDFLWVARERVTPVPGQLRPPPGRELVLDYIIERKRIDDLCGSIMDGRFKEQKFRLKRCGLHKPIYLVEECGSAGAHLSLPESTLQQAIINTQVVDGFFVKRVQDVKESAAYLTVMTRHLEKLYQNRTIICRSRELEGDGEPEARRQEKASCSLMSFNEFNQGAVKNKCQTVREVFARQLMQISGLSGDKAVAVLEHYSTVSSLLKAYDQCPSEADKEKLLSNIKYGKLKRNLGPALSRTVYQLYCTQGPLS